MRFYLTLVLLKYHVDFYAKASFVEQAIRNDWKLEETYHVYWSVKARAQLFNIIM